MPVPWWRGAVFYQIYPASFADSNGDGCGDLPGILAHLDHLAGAPHSLGIDAIWLSPFYRSPMRDFGYDVADHCAVDPRFGTLKDFDRLLTAAHARGLRVVIDFVPNHTSDQHPWFAEARASRDGARRDWYVWADPRPDGGPPNNWLSAFPRSGEAWTLDRRTGQYYLHSYTSFQPDLNWRNPAVQEAMGDVLRFWLARGVDGFRVDAPHRLAKDPAFADNPPTLAAMRLDMKPAGARLRNIDHPDVHALMRMLRATVDEYPGRVLLGEVGIANRRRWLRYYGVANDELHLLFNFPFWRCAWSAACFRRVVAGTEALLPRTAWPCYALSNHDMPRAVSRYGAGRARLAALLLLTLRGTPVLYYGEEIGMADVPVPADAAHDPDGRDPCRTPMQWTDGPAAGFTTGRPWLPVPPAPRANVAAQRHRMGSLLHFYRRLLRLRTATPALRAGRYFAHTAPAHVLAFERAHHGQRVLVALNFSTRPATLCISETGVVARLLISTLGSAPARRDLRPLRLHAQEGVVCALSGPMPVRPKRPSRVRSR